MSVSEGQRVLNQLWLGCTLFLIPKAVKKHWFVKISKVLQKYIHAKIFYNLV